MPLSPGTPPVARRLQSMARVAVAAALALLPACRCSEPRPPARERVVLTLWHTFNPEETRTLNRLLARVGAAHPEWRIQPTVIPFARAQNKFRQAARACPPGAPDVFRAELPWIPELASRRLIRPMGARAPMPADLLPQARAMSTYQARTWGLPASLDCLALLHNRRLVPDPPATLEGLIREARRQTIDRAGNRASGGQLDPDHVVRHGFYVRLDAYWFLPFLWAHGGRMLDPASGAIHIQDEPAVEALTLYRDLLDRHHVAPPHPSPAEDYEDQMRRFGTGRVAMIVNGPWASTALLHAPEFEDPTNLGIAPFPRGPGGAPAAPMSGHGYVVSRCAAHPRAAWALAAALSSEAAQVEFAARNSLLPAGRAAYGRRRVRANPRIAAFRRALDRSRPRPQHPAVARIFDDFTPAVQAVVLGDAEPAEALAGVARAWRRLLGTGPEPP